MTNPNCLSGDNVRSLESTYIWKFPKPTTPVVSKLARNIIELKWKSISPDATSYSIKQCKSDEPCSTTIHALETQSPLDSEITYTYLTSNAIGTYTYRVRACPAENFCNDAWGTWSDPQDIVVDLPAPMITQPMDQMGDGINGDATYTIVWASQSAAEKYKLQESSDGGETWTDVALSSDEQTARSKSLTNIGHVTYHYKVASCNNFDECGDWSTEKEMTISLATPMDITSDEITSISYDKAYAISWGSTLTTTSITFELEEKVGTNAWEDAQNTTVKTKEYTAKADGSYQYRVRACSGMTNCGDWSTIVQVEVKSLAAPQNLASKRSGANMTYENTTDSSIDDDSYSGRYELEWATVSQAGVIGITYKVEECEDDKAACVAPSATWALVVGCGDSAGIADTTCALTSSSKAVGNKYSYRVKAYAGNGAGVASSLHSIAIASLPQLTGLTSDDGASSSDGTYKLKWTKVTGATNYEWRKKTGTGEYADQDSLAFGVDSGSTLIATSPDDNSAGADEASYSYQMRACAGANHCGSWSDEFTVTVSSVDEDGDGVLDADDIDSNGNGLIEIDTLTELHNMRYNLAGTSYKTSAGGAGDSNGCPTTGSPYDPDGDPNTVNNITTCNGYELMNDLDFDKNEDGSSFGGANAGDCNVIIQGDDPNTAITETAYPRTDFASCSIDTNDVHATYFPYDPNDTANQGWLPIGDSSSPFTGIFEGNNHKIKNIFVKRVTELAGLFGSVGSGGNGQIQNIGIEGGLVVSSSDDSYSLSGDLVGYNTGTISNSYATGNVSSSSSDNDSYSGGLVGYNTGTIRFSHATGDVSSSNSSSSHSHDAYSGGLVGFNTSGTISNSYATGNAFSSSSEAVGGLVGKNDRGTISDSHSTGNVSSSSSEAVGGLVGWNQEGMISNSYATGDVSSYAYSNSLGGLVGLNARGTISDSYATGNASSNSSAWSSSGGLVGFNNEGTISNSYATGNASSTSSDISSTSSSGGLVGFNNEGTISNSYRNIDATITAMQNGMTGTIETAGTGLTETQLKAIFNSGTPYPSDFYSVEGTWNLGTSSQYPGLCIGGKIHRPTGTTGSFSIDSSADCPTPGSLDWDGDTIADANDVDGDGDGLIEIYTLTQLHNIRYNLAGTSYKTSDSDTGKTTGCPTAGGCIGYELMNDLDFDTGSNGTFSGDCNVIIPGDNSATTMITETEYPRTDFSSCTIDTNDVNATYFPNTNATNQGWLPIGSGSGSSSFTGTFEGNNHIIKNIFVKRDTQYAGLFGYLASTGQITNIGMEGGLIVASSVANSNSGGLVGESAGTISNSYSTGNISSSSVSESYSGGLVGHNYGGTITNSYATGNVSSSSNNNDPRSGGLVGYNSGMISDSYATGNVSSLTTSTNPSAGSFSGGLAGLNLGTGATISNSYSTGNVSSSSSSPNSSAANSGRSCGVES